MPATLAKSTAVQPPLAVKVRHAGAMLGLGLTSTWDLIRSGKLPHARFGRAVRVPVAAIEQLLAERLAASASDEAR